MAHYHIHRHEHPVGAASNNPRAASGWSTVLVCGASGNVGRAIANALIQLSSTQRIHVKVGVRGHDKLHEWQQKGAEAVIIDFADTQGLVNAMQDVDRVWITPPNPDADAHPFDRSRLTMNVIEAAKTAGVRYVLLGSVPGADWQRTLFQKEFHLVETHLKNTGLHYSILRMSLFMENIIASKRALRNGQFPLPLGLASYCPVSVVDIGIAAATILATPARYSQETLTITGPHSLSGVQMAAAASHVLMRDVTYVNAPPKAVYQTFSKVGMPEWQVGGLLELFDLFRTGEVSPLPSPDFQRITQRHGTSFEQCLDRLRQLDAI